MRERSVSQSPSQGHGYMGETWVPKIKRRRRFSTEETRILEKEYDKNSSPNQEEIQDIANIISTPRKIVTTWFQNRRAKNKRKERARTEEDESSSHGIQSINNNNNNSKKYNQVEELDNVEITIPDNNDNNNKDYIPTISSYYSNDGSCSQYNLNQPEVKCIENNVDLLLYNNPTLSTSPTINYYNTRSRSQVPTLTDTNQQFNLPQNSNNNNNNNQYFYSPQTNQQYSINIYNNMNNYLYPQQEPFEIESRSTRNMYDLNQQWFNYIFCQQYQNDNSFLFNNNNNIMNRNNNFPFIINNESTQFYINPTDIYLNRNQNEDE